MSRASDRIASRTAARAASGHDIGTNGWRGEIAGALSATVAMLPFVLSWGFIVYGALGAAGAQVGLTASVIAAVLGSAVMIAASGARLPSATPSASVALVLGAAVITLSRDPAIALSPAGGLPLILAATSAMVCAAGLLVLLLGASGAGRLVRYVPRPVLAGFMDGVAILIVMSQVPLLFGLSAEAWAREGLRALAELAVAGAGREPRHGAADGVRSARAGPRHRPRCWRWSWQASPWPCGARWQHPVRRRPACSSSAPLPSRCLTSARSARWHARATLDELIPHARLLVTTTLVLALVAAMESVLNLMAVDQRIDARSDPDRELIALGAASVVSGALGGLPLVFMRLRAVVAWNAGARDRRSMWLACAMLALLFALAAPLIERLSTAVIAGIVVMLAVGLFDRWTRQMLHQWRTGRHSAELGWSLAVVALVCAVTLGWGFAAGVLSGIVVAVWVFVRAMDRQLVRARFSAAEFPSRRVYAADERAGWRRCASTSACSSSRARCSSAAPTGCSTRCERLPRGYGDADRRPAPRDHGRCVGRERAGATRAAPRRARHPLAPVRRAAARPPRRRADARTASTWRAAVDSRTHANLDRAIEAAEQDALAAAMPGRAARMPLAQTHLFDGLDARQAQVLGAHMVERHLAAGERLFAQGDPGDHLYVLTAGSISVVDGQRGHRYVSFSPGMFFGEIALLDGGGRTADAVADVASTVHALSAEAFAVLQREEPALAAQVYRNLATNLSQRLRIAGAAWWHAAA